MLFQCQSPKNSTQKPIYTTLNSYRFTELAPTHTHSIVMTMSTKHYLSRITALLNSGEHHNIKLAYQIAEGLGINADAIALRFYEEIFELCTDNLAWDDSIQQKIQKLHKISFHQTTPFLLSPTLSPQNLSIPPLFLIYVLS